MWVAAGLDRYILYTCYSLIALPSSTLPLPLGLSRFPWSLSPWWLAQGRQAWCHPGITCSGLRRASETAQTQRSRGDPATRQVPSQSDLTRLVGRSSTTIQLGRTPRMKEWSQQGHSSSHCPVHLPASLGRSFCTLGNLPAGRDESNVRLRYLAFYLGFICWKSWGELNNRHV